MSICFIFRFFPDVILNIVFLHLPLCFKNYKILQDKSIIIKYAKQSTLKISNGDDIKHVIGTQACWHFLSDAKAVKDALFCSRNLEHTTFGTFFLDMEKSPAQPRDKSWIFEYYPVIWLLFSFLLVNVVSETRYSLIVWIRWRYLILLSAFLQLAF